MVELTPKQKKIADGYMQHGNKARAAREAGSRAVSTSAQTITTDRVLKNDKVQEYIRDMQYEASNKLVEHMHSENENISLKATESILDRGGNARISKSEVRKLDVQLTLDGEDMAQLSGIKKLLG